MRWIRLGPSYRVGPCLTEADLASLTIGTADPDRAAAWRRHIDECPECAARVERELFCRPYRIPPEFRVFPPWRRCEIREDL